MLGSSKNLKKETVEVDAKREGCELKGSLACFNAFRLLKIAVSLRLRHA
jgi:hypothetical protein